VNAALAWRAGRDSISHDVYVGADADSLALVDTIHASSYSLDALEWIDTTSLTTVEPGALDLGTTYYWRIDEVNEAEAISTWEGNLWSFSTQAYTVVDDFEGYDDEDNRIYQSWIDGYGTETNGSTVGHLESPFAEQGVVQGGNQSMPLFYDNSGTSMSEATLTLAQDWTTNGVKSLMISFQGAADNTGQLYVKINGAKVAYDGAATDIAETSWLTWTIDLSSVGGNLSNVTSLTIGIEGAGASGVVYIDDVRLGS